MADFEYAFASSGTPQSFPLDAGNAAGITLIDETNNVRVPKAERLAAGVYLLTIDATDATLTAAVRAYAVARGLLADGRNVRNVAPDGRTTLAASAVSAAD